MTSSCNPSQSRLSALLTLRIARCSRRCCLLTLSVAAVASYALLAHAAALARSGSCTAGRAYAPQPTAIYANGVEVDPQLAYYRGRSAESIASEIRANGWRVVKYVLTSDQYMDPKLLTAFRREGIAAWYATFANGVYSTDGLPPGWQKWRMVLRGDLEHRPDDVGYHFFCLNNPDYRAWKKRQVVAMLRRYPFAGAEILESFWPDYPGPQTPDYGCFCDHCRAAFLRMFPAAHGLPDILHPDAPDSPKRNPALWKIWLEFRRRSHTEFLRDLVDGPGGIRQSMPHVPVCVWSLALSGRDGMRHVLDDNGDDAGAIGAEVRPDMLCLQTHWPDWSRANLPPSYVASYAPFVRAARAHAPHMRLAIQADIGSQKQNRQTARWVADLERECARRCGASVTLYEYSIGLRTYTDPPRIASVHRQGDEIELVFTKRLDAQAASDVSHYALTQSGGARSAAAAPGSSRAAAAPLAIAAARVDGNLVYLTVQGLSPGRRATLTVRRIPDDASVRIFHDYPAAVLERQVVRVDP